MFIDISGFTSMTQSLMGHGKEGAEVLSNIINNIFTPSIKAIYDNGGFVSTFAGDAFTAIFDTERADYALKAAYEINKLFVDSGTVKTKFGEFELAVKIGLSHGEVEFGIIDAEVQKAFYFRGEAVDACAKSEHHSEKMQISADGKFIEKLSVQVEKQPKEEHWFILTPNELQLSPIQRKPGFVTTEEIEAEFILNEILNMKDRGEFREIVSVFIGFEESDGYTESIKQVIKNTHAYGGYFNKIDFGDKGGVMLVIFGAPTGREKLYSRAADFALSLKQMRDFKFRTGLSTGIAFCGIVGSELRKEYTALGNVVNLSARLMMKAEPYQTLTGPQIKSKLPAQYEFENKGLTEFKGFSDKIEIFSLLNKTANKLQLSYSGSFVGRKKEADELRNLIRPIYKDKFGGIIYIDGPAGIGKSRFIDNFVKNLDDCASFFLPCDEVLRKSFNPFEYFFKGYFEQSEALSKEENKANFTRKFAELVSQVKDEEIKSELIRTESVIAALIGLEWENSLYAQLDAKGKYENTLYAVKNFFLAQSLFNSVVLVVEDGHWIDSDSLALVETLIRNVEKYPIVILALCRPNDDGSVFELFDPEKSEIPLERLNIESFNKEMMNELLRDRFSSNIVPDKTSDFVWEKSNGNPFFVEQLVLYLTENNLLDNSMNLVSEASSIPSGISQIIIARIDRLSAEMKETVKTASVLGREFALRVLEKMLGSGIGLKEINILNELETGKNDKLWENLTELKYIFKHALIRETVYEIQLKETLRKLHDLAGNIIEDIYSDNIKEYFEELADHYDKAENVVKAIEYLEKAGYNAKINFRNEIAIVFYEKLLKYLSHNDYSEKKINTLIRIGDIFELTGKWDDSLNFYETALSLSEKIKSDILTATSLYKISFLTINRGDILKSIEMSEKALKLSERSNDYLLYSNILGALGVAYKEMNDYEKALNYLYIQRDKSSEYGDMRGCSDSIVNIGNIHLNKGDMNKAMECYTEANRISSDLGDKISLAKITGNLGLVYSNLGNYEKAKAFYKESMDICLQLGDKRGYSMSAGNLGLIYWSTSEYEKAQLCFEQKINVSLELGDKNGYSIALGNMGLIYDAKGNKEKAMEFLEASRTICKEIKDRRGYARACGNMGTIYLSIGDYKKAIDCFNENIEIYEELGEKRGYAIGIGNMGNIYENMGDYDNALKSYEKKMIICKELGIKKSYSIALNNIGNIYSIKNEFDKAMKCFDEAIDIGTELMIKDFLCEFYYSKAFLLYKLHNFSDAVSNADLAYKIAEEIESKTEMFNSQVLKHKINALEYPEKSVVSFENMLLNETEEKHVADLHYEIFVINRSVKNQKKALDLYEILYLKTPDILFKNRIAELKQDN
jgi:tetratricopeptide (TPR) repeat protein/class 3 adenylate cyclase